MVNFRRFPHSLEADRGESYQREMKSLGRTEKIEKIQNSVFSYIAQLISLQMTRKEYN